MITANARRSCNCAKRLKSLFQIKGKVATENMVGINITHKTVVLHRLHSRLAAARSQLSHCVLGALRLRPRLATAAAAYPRSLHLHSLTVLNSMRVGCESQGKGRREQWPRNLRHGLRMDGHISEGVQENFKNVFGVHAVPRLGTHMPTCAPWCRYVKRTPHLLRPPPTYLVFTRNIGHDLEPHARKHFGPAHPPRVWNLCNIIIGPNEMRRMCRSAR